MGPALRQNLIANESSTRQACKTADVADAKLAKVKQEAKFRAHVAAATAADDEWLSTCGDNSR